MWRVFQCELWTLETIYDPKSHRQRGTTIVGDVELTLQSHDRLHALEMVRTRIDWGPNGVYP